MRRAASATAQDEQQHEQVRPPFEARLQFARACLFNGRPDAAAEELGRLETAAGSDPVLLQQVGECYVHVGRQANACRCYERAVARAPDDGRARYNLAAAQVALGRLDDAEQGFTRVIEQNPHDYDAWQNLSNLRRQTPEDNHVGALRKLLEGGVRDPSGEVQLCYALAKEYEDLGEYDTSFGFLERGAAVRRRLLSYRVEHDVEMLEQLAARFDGGFAARVRAARERRP